jgi:hypothetical protein
MKVEGSTVQVLFTLNLLDFRNADLEHAIEANYRVEAPDPPSSVVIRQSEIVAENIVILDFLYKFSHPVTDLEISSTLDRATEPQHSHIVQIGEGDEARQAVIDAANPSVQIDLREKTFFATVWSFVKLGIEHIFTGYDHLAFLAGLLVLTTTPGSLFKVITSFTAAHSITLALATFGVVAIPSRLIESLIALSIAYIAIENFTGKMLIGRWKITFLFGLVHGFGFSNVLSEMVLTRRTLAISLFSFNAGVELGQLAFVGVVFPLVYSLAESRWKVPFRAATSCGIALLGLFWFVQRAM